MRDVGHNITFDIDSGLEDVPLVLFNKATLLVVNPRNRQADANRCVQCWTKAGTLPLPPP